MAQEMPEPVGGMNSDGRWKKTHRVWIPEVNANVQNELDRLRHDLKLEDRGARDGRENRPGHNDTSLNEAQLDICSRVFAGIQMLNQFLDQQVDLAVQRARELAPTDADVDHIKRATEGAIDHILGEHRSRLVALQEEDLRANRNLRFFRRQNGLLRDAYYEESVVKVAGIIMAMFVLESVINGSLFAQVVSTGLLGGAVLAGMISAINILSGIGAGVWGWRHITHRKMPLRILGVAVTLLCHSIAVFWNLFVAHFREVAEEFSARDSLQFDVSQIKDATIGHIHAHGLLGVESLQSWALLLLGLFIHFISAKEGWDDFADRYPDYKKYDVRAKTAHKSFETALMDLRDDVRDAIEEVEEDAEQSIANARNAYANIAELLDLAHQRRQEVRDSEEEWVAGGNRLLKAYREANLEIRDPGSAPAYFETYPSAADYRRCDFGGDAASSSDIEERKRSVENSLQELAELRDRAKLTADNSDRLLKSIHRHVTSALKNLDQRIHDETEKIAEQAEERLIEEGWGAGTFGPEPTRTPA